MDYQLQPTTSPYLFTYLLYPSIPASVSTSAEASASLQQPSPQNHLSYSIAVFERLEPQATVFIPKEGRSSLMCPIELQTIPKGMAVAVFQSGEAKIPQIYNMSSLVSHIDQCQLKENPEVRDPLTNVKYSDAMQFLIKEQYTLWWLERHSYISETLPHANTVLDLQHALIDIDPKLAHDRNECIALLQALCRFKRLDLLQWYFIDSGIFTGKKDVLEYILEHLPSFPLITRSVLQWMYSAITGPLEIQPSDTIANDFLVRACKRYNQYPVTLLWLLEPKDDETKAFQDNKFSAYSFRECPAQMLWKCTKFLADRHPEWTIDDLKKERCNLFQCLNCSIRSSQTSMTFFTSNGGLPKHVTIGTFRKCISSGCWKCPAMYLFMYGQSVEMIVHRSIVDLLNVHLYRSYKMLKLLPILVSSAANVDFLYEVFRITVVNRIPSENTEVFRNPFYESWRNVPDKYKKTLAVKYIWMCVLKMTSGGVIGLPCAYLVTLTIPHLTEDFAKNQAVCEFIQGAQTMVKASGMV